MDAKEKGGSSLSVLFPQGLVSILHVLRCVIPRLVIESCHETSGLRVLSGNFKTVHFPIVFGNHRNQDFT